MAISKSTRELISDHKVLTGFNRFIYFALAAIAINIADSFRGPYKDYRAVYILTGSLPLLFASLWLYKKNLRLAALVISATTFSILFFLITMHIGQDGGTYLYYFPFIIAYIYLFRAEGDKDHVLIFTLLSLGFLVFTLMNAPEEPPFFKIPAAKMKQIFLLTFCVSFLLTVYFFYLIFNYQENLYNRILELEKKNKKKQLRSVIETQEEGIQDIVNELRNNINQTLVASKYFLEKAVEENNNHSLIRKSSDLTTEAINALTMLCIRLHPAVIADVGFTEGTREYIDAVNKISESQVQFICDNPAIEEIPGKDKISVFRIIQEYLLIVLKNPGSSRITIEVKYNPPFITLAFTQNDPAFNFMNAMQPSGLSNMQNRITYFNGSIRQQQREKEEVSFVELSLN